MGTVLPNTPLGKIQFCENHNTPWSANAVAIGTTTTAVTDLATKTTAARAAFNAQQAAQQAAKVATSAYHQAVTAMASAASDIVKQVKAKAAVVGGDSVYDLAQIPSPATPSPLGPPGTPYDFAAQLDQTGTLRLAWTCDNPAGSTGTCYQISRQVGTTGAMQIIGAAGDKKFTDPSVPAGAAQVTYRVMAFRSTVAGLAGEFTVKFGAAPGSGELTASVVTAAPKLAA